MLFLVNNLFFVVCTTSLPFWHLPCRVFNKGRQPAKLTSYSTTTRCIFHWEIILISYDMRQSGHKTGALDWPRFIHEKQKNLAWILSNFSGDLCFLFFSNTLILAPKCRQCTLRGPNFRNFPGDWYPRTPLVHSLLTGTPKILPPFQIPIENLGLAIGAYFAGLWENSVFCKV